jgi:hypothetical protein
LLPSATIEAHLASIEAWVSGARDAGRGDGEVLDAGGIFALRLVAVALHMASIESCETGTPCFAAIEFPMARRV